MTTMVIHSHVCRCGVTFECVHDEQSSYPLICGDCADAELDTGRWPFACPDCSGGDPEVGVACADCARYDFQIERLREDGLA